MEKIEKFFQFNNVSLEPNAASSSNNNFNNNIYVQTPYPAEVKTDPEQSTFETREVELSDIEDQNDVKELILETYASILLNQDKTLIANLISKRTIVIPLEDLTNIIQTMTNGKVEIQVDEECGCCGIKSSLIRKIDAIKVIKDNIVVTDFKQYFNKEYNDLTGKFHMNLKYVLV